jgi:hypothetical protein
MWIPATSYVATRAARHRDWKWSAGCGKFARREVSFLCAHRNKTNRRGDTVRISTGKKKRTREGMNGNEEGKSKKITAPSQRALRRAVELRVRRDLRAVARHGRHSVGYFVVALIGAQRGRKTEEKKSVFWSRESAHGSTQQKKGEKKERGRKGKGRGGHSAQDTNLSRQKKKFKNSKNGSKRFTFVTFPKLNLNGKRKKKKAKKNLRASLDDLR